MDGFDAFLDIFGSITLETVILVGLALAFLIMSYVKFKKYLIKKHELHQEETRQLQEALGAVRQYPKYREQSIEIQHKLQSELQEIKQIQANCIARLDQIEEDNKRRERNKLRDLLLQNYRFYTSKEHNPKQEWTKMEAEAFWEMFNDYELAGGNGYMHTTVQPEMSMLAVIDMSNCQEIVDLMQHRK